MPPATRPRDILPVRVAEGGQALRSSLAPVALLELRRLVAAVVAAGPTAPRPLLATAGGTLTGPGHPGDHGVGPAGSTGEEAERERIAALVTLAQQGDAEAFGQVYDRYVGQIYRYLYYRVGSHALAEDLTSETFLRALRRIDSFTYTGKDIGAWFTTIARNLVTDHVKSSRFRLEVSTADMLDADRGDDGIEAQVLERLQNAALLDAVRGLRADQQECIVLRFLQGLSVAETAEVMGRSTGAVKQLQLRAVRALANLLPESAR
jgi:RNA polymerase sigma-70 factor, ECF subfamily